MTTSSKSWAQPFIGLEGLSDDAFAQENRLRQTARHHGISVHQRKQELQVLLRPAEVFAERRAPLFAIRPQRVLQMPLGERLSHCIGREQRRPAVGINVLKTSRIEPALGAEEKRS